MYMIIHSVENVATMNNITTSIDFYEVQSKSFIFHTLPLYSGNAYCVQIYIAYIDKHSIVNVITITTSGKM